MMTVIEDGVIVQGRPMNAAEKAEQENWAADIAAAEQVRADELAAAEEAKDSAHTKLSDWGLSPAEIAAILSP
jgi:hypothetical protein